jgi:hypothetical protein
MGQQTGTMSGACTLTRHTNRAVAACSIRRRAARMARGDEPPWIPHTRRPGRGARLHRSPDRFDVAEQRTAMLTPLSAPVQEAVWWSWRPSGSRLRPSASRIPSAAVPGVAAGTSASSHAVNAMSHPWKPPTNTASSFRSHAFPAMAHSAHPGGRLLTELDLVLVLTALAELALRVHDSRRKPPRDPDES